MRLFKIVKGFVKAALVLTFYEFITFLGVLFFDVTLPFGEQALLLLYATYILYIPMVVMYLIQPERSEMVTRGLFLILMLLIVLVVLFIVILYHSEPNWFEL